MGRHGSTPYPKELRVQHQLHRPDPAVPYEESVGALVALRSATRRRVDRSHPSPHDPATFAFGKSGFVGPGAPRVRELFLGDRREHGASPWLWNLLTPRHNCIARRSPRRREISNMCASQMFW
ncbi:MAG: hypothetical protein JWM72_4452 [Actinomycetia bacterium]|nr:hypothetical protein [Actinomycetes bacterium]